VVVVTPDTYDAIRATVRHLRVQTIVDQLELLIMAPSAQQVEIPPDDVAPFACWRVVEVPGLSALAYAKAQAVQLATAPIVAFTEDHSFPEPGWAEALIAAYRNGCAGVAPQMKNANPTTVLSWCAMFLHFGAAVEPEAEVDCKHPAASHNTSYRRDALLAFGDDLGRRMLMESFLCEALRGEGHRIRVEPLACTRHVNMSRLRPVFGHAFVGGRLYGALRSEFGGWSPLRRLIYAGGFALVPLLRLRRVTHEIRRTSHRKRLLPRAIPGLLAILFVHAAGEAAGYLLGVGDTDATYSRFETHRERYVSPAERSLWA